MSKQRLSEFEAWLLKSKPVVGADMLKEGSFVSEWMFEAYCAALDSVVIELPQLVEPEPPDEAFDDSWRDGYSAADRYRRKCQAAIHAAGVKTK